MAKPLQLIQVLKWESSAGGGDPADDTFFPDEIEPGEDVLSSAGVALQASGIPQDNAVQIWRDTVTGDMMFEDPVVGSGVPLIQLLTGSGGGSGGMTPIQHRSLHQLIHFLDDGPGVGFTSGAYRTTVASGPFPVTETWWTNSGQTQKIVEKSTTYTGAFPLSESWTMYNEVGTAIATAADAITYPTTKFEPHRLRTLTIL